MVVPGLAAKGAQTASKALTGDIYVRRWTSVQGKGKKRKEIDHEVRVNPVGVGLGAAAIGLGVVAIGVGLWASQLRLTPYKETVNYGYWYFYQDSSRIPRIGDIDERNKGEPPTKQYWVEGTGHWEATGTGIIKGPLGYSQGAKRWVEDTPGYYNTETATWKPTRTIEGRKRFSIEQRQGFGLTNPLEFIGAGAKALFDPLGLFK